MTAKRGRRSVGDLLNVAPVTGQRLVPPSHLTPDQEQEWRAIVDSLPADYFRPGDVPLLAAYCVASTFYKRAASEMETRGLIMTDDKGREYVNPAHQILTSQASSMAQLAIKLRLCPSARYSEKAAATKAGDAAKPSRPWETGT
jgi:P27 family predicted phage terminase small subunit